MKNTPQDYPRISDEENKYYGFLDETQLNDHIKVLSEDEIKSIVREAIINANKKSGRSILNIPEGLSQEQINKIYRAKGIDLFHYFQRYCGDPASSANDCTRRSYIEVAKEQYRNLTLQKERMNSGWRYQYIAKDGAIHSERFNSVSDIGTAEADFNVSIGLKKSKKFISIYVSVKNRTNTMGGQDWPKAIRALEEVAKKDKNRTCPYLCVFGIAMEKGSRIIKTDSKTKTAYSNNTEMWKSDFFWPFFTNLSYGDIVKTVLNVLIEMREKPQIDFQIPELLIESFGEQCKKYKLIDTKGIFNDPHRLVDFFVGNLDKK